MLPDDFITSSVDFKNTKMFYGNAFEKLTSHVTVLALINNILNGRNFDSFEKMDLKKYSTIDKANRCNPFNNNPEFYKISECIDSTLRNASHHGAIKYERGFVVYRSAGYGAEHKIPYSAYLYKCVEIQKALAVLLMIELLIISFSER